ncbi:hypothetical protein B296_00031926 [Ensete ventricosum]|uniref:Uncharacterized protein n=1 Tax=Ensete ventricosum TaxID=4639 RepID=A0A427AF11_ENSVE|nr:hypothetical protein B296_00031926 [Ensete ventricosum]
MLGTLRPSSYCSVRSFRPQPEDPQWPSPRASSRGTKSSRYSRWARWSSASSFEVSRYGRRRGNRWLFEGRNATAVFSY